MARHSKRTSIARIKDDRLLRQRIGTLGSTRDVRRPSLANETEIPVGQPRVTYSTRGIECQGPLQQGSGFAKPCFIHTVGCRDGPQNQVVSRWIDLPPGGGLLLLPRHHE